jgi:hypothetical protein
MHTEIVVVPSLRHSACAVPLYVLLWECNRIPIVEALQSGSILVVVVITAGKDLSCCDVMFTSCDLSYFRHMH